MSSGSRLFQSTHPREEPSMHGPRPLSLYVCYPPDLAGAQIPLAQDLILGRSPEPGVASIFHPTISRQHAKIRIGARYNLFLHELGSRNGTRVNGLQVNGAAPLIPQTVVRLGDVIGVVDEPCTRAFGADDALPGTSPEVARAGAELARTAADPASVLVVGETGTGKERVAARVHELSGRSGRFVAVNCAELSPQLVESQLFGHQRGAFTGAHASQVGLFVAANGGTLFMDEIGELPLDLQPKLLRAVQEGMVRPVGSVETRPVDVRIVAATNRDLSEAVEAGRFRRDLYARLSLLEVRLPPLKQRRQDILLWVQRLLEAWNRERHTARSINLMPDAAEQILLFSWLDNLRGLDRLVHRLSALAHPRPISLRVLADTMPDLGGIPSTGEAAMNQTDTATAADAAIGSTPPVVRSSTAPPAQGSTPPRDVEGMANMRPSREELLSVYQATGCSVRATSKHFGKERRQIYRWLDSYGIERKRG